jgi:hypothetical protein
MKERSLWVVLGLVVVVLTLCPATVHAQATPTATPTPTLPCSLTALPSGCNVDCRTGAETASSSFKSYLGVSGGNYNSLSYVTTGKKNNKTTTVTCCTGTLGALVEDSSNQYVLGSAHNFARNSGAKTNEPIIQPGLVDLGCWQPGVLADKTLEDQVATLYKSVPIKVGTSVNQYDAAIAKVVNCDLGPAGPAAPGIDPAGEIFNLGAGPTGQTCAPGQISATPFPYDDLRDGMFVMKMGRGSCLTTGQIDAFDAMGKVVYPATCNVTASGTAYFDHQILVIGASLTSLSSSACTFVQSGDSGALVMTYTDQFTCAQAIGIVFAATPAAGTLWGPDTGQIAAVTPIQTILTEFGVTLVGDSSCAPAPPLAIPLLQTAAGDATVPAEMSDALRASIAQVRQVKEAYARRLLKHRHVVAVGIGAGDDPYSAALNVYLNKDTPAVRSRVAAELGESGTAESGFFSGLRSRRIRVKFRHAEKLRAL